MLSYDDDEFQRALTLVWMAYGDKARSSGISS